MHIQRDILNNHTCLLVSNSNILFLLFFFYCSLTCDWLLKQRFFLNNLIHYHDEIYSIDMCMLGQNPIMRPFYVAVYIDVFSDTETEQMQFSALTLGGSISVTFTWEPLTR